MSESSNKVLLSGNEAIARGVWEAGVTFGSGYPGTPSSEILPALAKLGDVYAEWAVNEKCALEAGAGASVAGARCIVTMKHVGLNVAADPLFTLAYVGVNGGMVIISADDPHMHSSQNEQDSRNYGRAAKIPILEPADTQEAYEYAKLALEMSERFDIPVLLRPTTRLCHSDGVVAIGERQRLDRAFAPQRDPQKYVMIPAHARARRRSLAERMHRLAEFAETESINREEPGSAEVGIIAAGIAYEYAKDAMPEASFLKLGMSFPLPAERLRRFAASVEKLYVIEELDPFLATEIAALGIKLEPLPESLQLGELNPNRVRAALAGEDVAPVGDASLAPRPPVLCAGCPHRGVFLMLRKLKAFVTGDIGCYTLGTLPPLGALHTCLCMGAGIGEAHGIDKACGGPADTVAVIGDSTFLHSGITGLLNIAYNNGRATVVILDNSTTAMTGGQEHPATGRTLQGMPARRVDLEQLCRACGVDHVQVVNPRETAVTEQAIRDAMAHEGPSVVIARYPCVLVSRERGKAYVVNDELCIRCGACLRLGCPAISKKAETPGTETEGDRPRPIIDLALCQGCALCVQACPKDAIAEA